MMQNWEDGRYTRWVCCPSEGPGQAGELDRHGHAGASPVKDCRDTKGTGTSDIGEAEREANCSVWGREGSQGTSPCVKTPGGGE